MDQARFWDRFAPKHDHEHMPDELDRLVVDAAAVLGRKDRLLDVGCAAGASTVALRRHVRSAHGIDISPARIQVARRHEAPGLTFASMTLDDPALKHGRFTAIIMFNVLHHLDAAAALARCHELLPKGGRLILHDACFSDASLIGRVGVKVLAWLMRMPPMDHHTAAELEGMVTAAGFRIETSEARGSGMAMRWIVATA